MTVHSAILGSTSVDSAAMSISIMVGQSLMIRAGADSWLGGAVEP